MEKRLNEIRERKAEIRKALNDKPDMTTDELRGLTGELENLDAEMQKLEARHALMDKLGPEATPEQKPADLQRSREDTRGEQLRRGKSVKLGADELRALLFSGGNISAPKGNGANVSEPMNTVSSIIDMVETEDLTGMTEYTETYIEHWQEAGDHPGEGKSPNESDLATGMVKITPKPVSVISYVSKDIYRVTNVQLEDKVRRGASIALRQKVADMIQTAAGAPGPVGLYNCKSYVTGESETPKDMHTTLIAKLDSGSKGVIDEKTLRNIVMNFGGDNNIIGGAVLFLNKKDLLAFGDVRGTNEKKYVYEITPDAQNPNTGIIKDGGVSVRYCICPKLNALSGTAQGDAAIPTMVYGVPRAYKLGLFGPFEVEMSRDYKFAEGLIAVRGEAMIGGTITRPEAYEIVTIPSKAAS
ncbi:phage major capsid protein [Beduinella massiliensis]|uniref:phage major capsid protein n=1 Tax=Beduinella massiliensis TaxID=1852363 RepID=UPI000C81EB56